MYYSLGEISADSGHLGSRLAQVPLAAVNGGGLAQPSSPVPKGPKFSPPNDRGARTYWIWAVCGFLLLAVGLVFGQTMRHELIGIDDRGYVLDPQITPGLTLPGLWWALTDGPFGEWYPVTVVSHMLDWQLYGQNLAGHFVTNTLLHATSSVLLFLMLLRMTGALWPSAWVAAIFAIHPLHVESVAWLAERRDVLSGLFFMLTLLAYTLYAERPSLARYLCVAGCFALGLMSKPVLVTVPFLLLLLDYWPLNRFRSVAVARRGLESRSWFGRLPVGWQLMVEKIPLMALAALSSGIVLLTHLSLQPGSASGRISLATRLANALLSYAAYLGQSFFPVDLAFGYPHLGTRLPVDWIIGSLVLLVAITAVATYFWRQQPYVLVGWLWFLGMLVPVIGLVPVGVCARCDHFTYLSQIGLSIGLAWSVWSVYQSRQAARPARWRQWMLGLVSMATVLTLAAVAWRQTSYWSDTETFWTHTLACTEENVVAHYCLGGLYMRQGRTEEAITQFREAVATKWIVRSLFAKSHGLLAECLTSQGKIDEAITHFEQMMRIFPSAWMGHARLATALASADRHDQAIIEWRETIRLAPAYWPARVGLANALLAIGDASEAANQCREALKQEPNSVEAIVLLATILAAEGQAEEALPHFKRAVEIDPRDSRAHFQLGLVLHDRGRSQSARTHLDTAIRLAPDDVSMMWQTAWILATSPDASFRDGAEAVELAKRATRLTDGREPHALDTLAAALAEVEEFAAAVDTAEQASTIALTHGDAALADAIDQRTRLYRQSLPYHQPASLLPTGQAPPAAAE